MKSFCDRFGLPGGGRPDLRGGRPQFVLVDELLRHQRQIRRALSLLQEGDSSARLIKYWNSSEEPRLSEPNCAQAETAALRWSLLHRISFRRCGFNWLSSPALAPNCSAASAAMSHSSSARGQAAAALRNTARTRAKSRRSKSGTSAEGGIEMKGHLARGRRGTGPSFSTCAIPKRESASANGTRSAEPSARRRPSARASSQNSRKAHTLSLKNDPRDVSRKVA